MLVLLPVCRDDAYIPPARSKRCSRAETIYLINSLEELEIIKRTDGRKHKNCELFKAARLNEGGFADRDATQVKNKWNVVANQLAKFVFFR